MRLFMFKSENKRGLRAFAADPGGEKLPTRHGQWTVVGVVRKDSEPSYSMKRKFIEKSISDQDFQLYKLKRAEG